MRSEVKTVEQYLKTLPDDRKKAISQVRRVILENLPRGYEEQMNWGMISYQIPLERYPNTYNGQPLMYAALASQKNHMAVYLTGIYTSEKSREDFETAYKASGKRFDAGKSCVRFKKIEDLPLQLIGKTISSMSVEDLIRVFEHAHSRRKKKEK